MRIPRLIVFAVALMVASSGASVDAVFWSYNSNDAGTGGTNTVTGQLTTDGSLADVDTTGFIFHVLSIDTVIVNGVDLADPSNWYSGEAPPFTAFPASITDEIITTAPGQAVVPDARTGVQLLSTPNEFNVIQLARSGAALPIFTIVGISQASTRHASFIPTSTTFTVIPEPSAFLYLALIGAGALGVAKVKSRWANRKHPGQDSNQKPTS